MDWRHMKHRFVCICFHLFMLSCFHCHAFTEVCCFNSCDTSSAIPRLNFDVKTWANNGRLITFFSSLTFASLDTEYRFTLTKKCFKVFHLRILYGLSLLSAISLKSPSRRLGCSWGKIYDLMNKFLMLATNWNYSHSQHSPHLSSTDGIENWPSCSENDGDIDGVSAWIIYRASVLWIGFLWFISLKYLALCTLHVGLSSQINLISEILVSARNLATLRSESSACIYRRGISFVPQFNKKLRTRWE